MNHFKGAQLSGSMLSGLVVCVALAGATGEVRDWMNRADPPGVRAKALLAKMTFDEKVQMLHGPISP